MTLTTTRYFPGLFVRMRVGNEHQLSVLPRPVGDEALDESVVTEIPIHGPVIDVVRPLSDFGAHFIGDEICVRNDESLQLNHRAQLFRHCDGNIKVGQLKKLHVTLLGSLLFHDLAWDLEQYELDP